MFGVILEGGGIRALRAAWDLTVVIEDAQE